MKKSFINSSKSTMANTKTATSTGMRTTADHLSEFKASFISMNMAPSLL
jgi:hypothetical protein